jgi:hypothetical protein
MSGFDRNQEYLKTRTPEQLQEMLMDGARVAQRRSEGSGADPARCALQRPIIIRRDH